MPALRLPRSAPCRTGTAAQSLFQGTPRKRVLNAPQTSVYFFIDIHFYPTHFFCASCALVGGIRHKRPNPAHKFHKILCLYHNAARPGQLGEEQPLTAQKDIHATLDHLYFVGDC